MVWKGDANNRLAKSLATLIDDITQKFPGRDHDNDGTIGDVAHQQNGAASDHNPHVHQGLKGIVTALDITHDPGHGFDAGAFAESLRLEKDPRIKYVIFNGRIFNSKQTPWVWRDRNKGPGDHSHHVHISVVDDPALYDDPKPWVYDQSHAVSANTEPSPPKLQLGSTGPAVIELQNLLNVSATGVFGSDTDAAVRQFQASRNLFVDGVVGTHTWGALNVSVSRPSGGGDAGGLSPTAIDKIVELAADSELARVNWPGRGVAPLGYIKGMALTFGRVYAKFKSGDSAASLMATMNSGNGEVDALAWYDAQFQAAGMSNAATGAATLRHLFVLLTGLGMRESSGQYSIGRDMAAQNTDADTAEAGLFQMSWNARAASSEIPKLFAAYSAKPDGFLSIFQEGVTPKPSDLQNFGTGEGVAFQQLCKTCPAFAVEAAGVGLRVLRKHWGPINNHAAEIRQEADRLLAQVQGVVDMPDAIVHAPAPFEGRETHSVLEALKRIFEQLTKDGGATMPAPANNNPISLLEQVAKLIQTINPQNKPAAQPPADQQFDVLQKVIGMLMPIINPGAAVPPAAAPLGQVNGALGQTIGNLLNGKKTGLGAIGAVLTSLLSATSGTDTGIGKLLLGLVPAAGLSQFAMPVFLGLAAWGVLGKLEKWVQGKVATSQVPK